MSDDVLVRVENVSKRFCRSLKRSLWYGMQDLGSELGGRRLGGGSGLPQSSADVELRKDEFWAVKDVSFELRRGECLGLIGRNGAGKTTLLRMLNGLIKTDTGRIEMNGEVGALIALGAGFNPTLTGRENVLINAGVLGITRQRTKEKMEEIISFSEIGDFIDTPVQSYSSGMQVRLGFAVATVMNPDILILDEVLSVGDHRFRAKCKQKIAELRSRCATILVSHHQGELQRVCDSGLFLGKLKAWPKATLDMALEQYEKEQNMRNGSPETIRPILTSSIPSLSFCLSVVGSRFLKSTDQLIINLKIDAGFEIEIRKAFINLIDESRDVQASIPLNELIGMKLDKSLFRVETDRLMLSNGRYGINCYIETVANGLLVNAIYSDWFEIHSEFEKLYSSNLILASCCVLKNH